MSAERAFPLLLVVAAFALDAAPDEPSPRWFKAALHTHSSQSDGTDPPETVARLYARAGYDVLALTDHNVVTKVPNAPLLVLPGEELTDTKVHLSLLGLDRPVQPRGALEKNLLAAPPSALVVVNHPNYGWALDADDIAQSSATFLEVFNGHPDVMQDGDRDHPPVEHLWDLANTTRALAGRPLLYGIATDDSHGPSMMGTGWVSVRSTWLTRGSILEALRAGDFYASSGPVITDLARTASTLSLTVGPGITTELVTAHGEVLQLSRSESPTFEIPKDALYLRARVTDASGRRAWTQPFVP